MSASYAPLSTVDLTAAATTTDSTTTSTKSDPTTTTPPPTFRDIDGKIDGTTRATAAAPIDDSLEGKIVSTAPSSAPPTAVASAAASTGFFGTIVGALTSGMNTNNSAEGAPNSSMFGFDQAEVSGLVSQLKSRKWMATLRPVPSFAGAGMFSKPRTTAEAMTRIEQNLPFYLTNYLLICALVTVITLLSQPSLVFVGLLLATMWLFASKRDNLQIGAVALQGRAKMIALTSVTGVVLFIFAGTTIFCLVGLCATIVLGHALLHNLPPLDEAELNDFNSPDSLA